MTTTKRQHETDALRAVDAARRSEKLGGTEPSPLPDFGSFCPGPGERVFRPALPEGVRGFPNGCCCLGGNCP
jgi:hypothetical protein